MAGISSASRAVRGATASAPGEGHTLARQSVGEERIEWDIIVCVCRELHYEMMVE